MNLSAIRKTVAAVIGVGLTWVTAAFVPDQHVTVAEWVALAVALATALGVYHVPNDIIVDPEWETAQTDRVIAAEDAKTPADAGHVDHLTVLSVIAVAALVLVLLVIFSAI